MPGPDSANDPLPIVVEALNCRLGGREVLHGIGFAVRRGTTLGILGPNGCGKTTLLRCVAGLLAPSAGRVSVMGADVSTLPAARLARWLALQAQDGTVALGYTVWDVVGMGRLVHRTGPFGGDGRRDAAAVAGAIDAMELADLTDRPIETLSGGERQRAMIARAIAQEPAVLLLDEPTNHLDIRHRFAVLDRIRRLGITVVATLHDIELAARTCDRLLLLHDGRVVGEGAPESVLTAAAIAAVYGVAAAIDRQPATGQMRIDLQPFAEARP